MKRSLQALLIGLGLVLVPWQTAHAIYRILPYPLFGQLETKWCWAATDQMLRWFFGDYADQCQIANFGLGKTTCCSTFPAPAECNVASNLTVLNMSGQYQVQKTEGKILFSQIRTQLVLRGRPVIYSLQYVGSSTAGHIRTITGVYDEAGEWVLINDSWPVGTASQLWIPYTNYVGSDALGYNVSKTYHEIKKL